MLTALRTTWQSAGWIRYLICVPLWLSLWNAPLPWIHRHDAAEARADGDLARHLQTFHRDADAEALHEAESWHWHFAFLWQMMECDHRPAAEQNSHSISLTEANVPCPNAPEISPRELLERHFIRGTMLADALPPADWGRSCAFPAGHSRQFLQTFLAGTAIRDLLGVARC